MQVSVLASGGTSQLSRATWHFAQSLTATGGCGCSTALPSVPDCTPSFLLTALLATSATGLKAQLSALLLEAFCQSFAHNPVLGSSSLALYCPS